MIRELERKDRTLYLTLLVNFSLMGGVVTLFGAALAKVIETYGWSYTDAGTIYAAASVGFFVSSLATGFLIDHFGWRPVLTFGLAAEAISLVFFARTPNVPLNVALYFVVGIGLGSNEAITNAVVVRLEERGKSRLMNLMHAFWCVGAVVGPLGVANLIRTRVSWQIVFPVFGALILGMTVLLAFQRFPAPAHRRAGKPDNGGPERSKRGAGGRGGAGTDRSEIGISVALDETGAVQVPDGQSRGAGRGGIRVLLGSGAGAFVLLCALSIFVYIGVEKGVYGWVSAFFVKVLGTSLPVGAAMVALYWTGQFLGRLGISVVYRGNRLELVFAALSTMTVVSLALLVFVRVTWLAVACTFIAGVANSGIFPLVISLTGKYSSRGRAVGFVTSAGGIAGFFFPIFVATVSDAVGMARGFETVLFIGAILLVVSLIVVARVRRMDREEPARDPSEARIA